MGCFAPDFVHSFDACLLKTAFQQWNKPLVTIHDCIAVLPNDMDDAQERIRRAMIHICQGDPLAKLSDDLKVSPNPIGLLETGKGKIKQSETTDKMFN